MLLLLLLQVLGSHNSLISLDLPLLIDATFCAGSAMIASGAVLGKTTPTQLMWDPVPGAGYYTVSAYAAYRGRSLGLT